MPVWHLAGLLVLVLLHSAAATTTSTSCDQARLKCAFRVGCGMALHNYMIGCSDLMAGRTNRCPSLCSRALIALTSTDEGQALEECDCDGSDTCEQAKKTIEICRPTVSMASLNASVVSCTVAQWICAADPLCSTALGYYHRFCRALVHGKRCTARCNNSIAILRRQDKAAKLRTCLCDGTEDFDCAAVKSNTQRLCFPNELTTTPVTAPTRPNQKIPKKPTGPSVMDTSASTSASSSPPLLLLLVLLMLLLSRNHPRGG